MIGTLALIATACATAPPARDNPWADLAIEFERAPRPVDLPAWPLAEACGDRLCLTPAAAATLNQYAEVAEANQVIARSNAAAVDELTGSYNRLVESGAAEHTLAEMRGLMLFEERRARLLEKWLWGGVGFAGLLLGLTN